MDDDVKRFIALVKQEADKDEDFVEDRVKNSTLYKLLESKYDNINDIMKLALKKSEWIERLREEFADIDYTRRDVVVAEKARDAERLMFVAAWKNKPVYDKCMWRYGKEEVLKVAGEVLNKTRDEHGIYRGKQSTK